MKLDTKLFLPGLKPTCVNRRRTLDFGSRTFLRMSFIAALLLLLSFSLADSSSSKRIHLVILGTTDLHGNLYPIDYYTNKPDNRGLAKVSTLIKQFRKENQNVLLIDSGDTIQGTPLETRSEE